MSIDLDVDTPKHTECEGYSFDQYTMYQRDLGRFGMRVYGPDLRQLYALQRDPELNVVFGQGWLQGVDATNEIAQLFASQGHLRFASIKRPEGTHDISELVPFYTDVLKAGTHLMLSQYTGPLVIKSYSRGSSPATNVAEEFAPQIAGLQFVEPTWFEGEPNPAELAVRGVREGLGSLFRRDSLADKVDLLHMGAHALKEAVHRPLEHRRDVSAIAREARPGNLVRRLANIRRVGVAVGKYDGICPKEGVLSVAQDIIDSDPERDVNVIEVDVGHFGPFKNRRSRAELIEQLYRLAS